MKGIREFFVLFLQYLCKSEIILKKQNRNLSFFAQLPQSPLWLLGSYATCRIGTRLFPSGSEFEGRDDVSLIFASASFINLIWMEAGCLYSSSRNSPFYSLHPPPSKKHPVLSFAQTKILGVIFDFCSGSPFRILICPQREQPGRALGRF